MFAWIFRTFWLKMAVLVVWGKGWCDVDPIKLLLTFGGCYLCATFGANRSTNATVRVRTDRHAVTETNWIYSLSCAICYSYGTDNNDHGSCNSLWRMVCCVFQQRVDVQLPHTRHPCYVPSANLVKLTAYQRSSMRGVMLMGEVVIMLRQSVCNDRIVCIILLRVFVHVYIL